MRLEFPVATGNKNPTPHNFRIEHRDGYSVAYSYRTAIGFNRWDGTGWHVSENLWSNTTARHLSTLGRQNEYHRASFERLLAEVERTAE